MNETPLRAIMVAVNYSDLLSITLPYNRHHFDQVMIVTNGRCYEEVRRIVDSLSCDQNYIHVTEVFTDRGATFNKWKALEQGLDKFGRFGWLVIMDADVLWPKVAPLDRILRPGFLYSPLRRMMTNLEDMECKCCEGIGKTDIGTLTMGSYTEGMTFSEAEKIIKESERTCTVCNGKGWIYPSEETWGRYPIHRNINEWAGYSQIFNCADPVLGDSPWHQVDWKHAGGADSFFQAKWPRDRKIRPDWNVLHLGESGVNWMGRSSNYMDGTVPENAEQKYQAYLDIWPQRRKRQREGLDPFEPERIKE
jgi:hypothetical protein